MRGREAHSRTDRIGVSSVDSLQHELWTGGFMCALARLHHSYWCCQVVCAVPLKSHGSALPAKRRRYTQPTRHGRPWLHAGSLQSVPHHSLQSSHRLVAHLPPPLRGATATTALNRTPLFFPAQGFSDGHEHPTQIPRMPHTTRSPLAL
jgi:hypothetical protein